MNFAGARIVVTGASSGIGRACVQAFCDAGATVVLGVARDRDKLKAMVGPYAFQYYPADLCSEGVERRLAGYVLATYGSIDVLVNAAGVFSRSALGELTDVEWARTIDLNLSAPMRLSRAFLPLFEPNGSIVNVSSINSERPFAGTLAYSVSKAGVDQMTRVLALELAPSIRVNAVNPGVVATDLHRRSGMSEADYEAFLDRCRETHPLGRVGKAAEVAEAVLFLAGHKWITGVCLPVDGGRSLTVVR